MIKPIVDEYRIRRKARLHVVAQVPYERRCCRWRILGPTEVARTVPSARHQKFPMAVHQAKSRTRQDVSDRRRAPKRTRVDQGVHRARARRDHEVPWRRIAFTPEARQRNPGETHPRRCSDGNCTANCKPPPIEGAEFCETGMSTRTETRVHHQRADAAMTTPKIEEAERHRGSRTVLAFKFHHQRGQRHEPMNGYLSGWRRSHTAYRPSTPGARHRYQPVSRATTIPAMTGRLEKKSRRLVTLLAKSPAVARVPFDGPSSLLTTVYKRGRSAPSANKIARRFGMRNAMVTPTVMMRPRPNSAKKDLAPHPASTRLHQPGGERGRGIRIKLFSAGFPAAACGPLRSRVFRPGGMRREVAHGLGACLTQLCHSPCGPGRHVILLSP